MPSATPSNAWTKKSASIGWGGNDAAPFRTTKPMIDYINRAVDYAREEM